MKTLPAYVFAAVALSDLVAGTVAGWFVAKGRAVERERLATERAAAPAAVPSNPGDPAEALPETRAGGDLKAAEAEVAALAARAAELESKVPKARSLEEKRAFAREAVEMLRREAPEDRDRFLLMIPDLDAEMAAVFVEALKEETDDDHRETMFYLILECGGPDAAAYVNGLIENPEGRKAEMGGLQHALAKIIKPFGFRRFQVDGELLGTAHKLLESTEPDRRMLGAGLFAFRDTDDARETLQRFVETDAERAVRVSALRSLCRIGTPATKEWLDRWERGLTTEEASEMQAVLEKSRRELEFRLNR